MKVSSQLFTPPGSFVAVVPSGHVTAACAGKEKAISAITAPSVSRAATFALILFNMYESPCITRHGEVPRDPSPLVLRGSFGGALLNGLTSLSATKAIAGSRTG